jgi:hypothetical protein
MSIMHVTAPTDRMKELILQEHPKFYNLQPETQREIVKLYIKECDVEIMFDYMQETKEGERDE